MKKIFLTITILMVLLSSCERIDYNDINQNPYSPTEDNIDAMLLGGMLSYSQLGNRAGYSVASLYAQYQAQFAYSNEQLYNQFPGEWKTNYVDILSNLKVVANTTEDLRGSTVNMNAIAELMSVLVWKRVTDTFGDVPYFEALQGGNNITPAYTTQRDIYIDLISRVKDARDMIDSTQFVPNANTDIFYAGDMAKWGKFANSLLLSLTIQLSNTDLASMAQTEFNNALNNGYGVMESNDEVFTPDLGGGNQNPISTQRSADYNLSKELTDALNGYNGPWGAGFNDPKNVTSTAGNTPDYRLAKYSSSNMNDGIPYGFQSYPGGGADMNNTLDSEGSDYTLFSAAYTWLNRAEGALIYASDDDSNTMLTNAIVTSYDQHGLQASDGEARATLRITNVTGEVTLAQVIGEEKWFALFPDGFSAWTEYRRTGYPMLHAAPEATNGGIIPHRMIYPIGEASSNPDGYSQGVQGLTPADDKNTSKIWWE